MNPNDLAVDWARMTIELTKALAEARRERDEARAEVERLKKQFDDSWYECHDGSEQACSKAHE